MTCDLDGHLVVGQIKQISVLGWDRHIAHMLVVGIEIGACTGRENHEIGKHGEGIAFLLKNGQGMQQMDGASYLSGQLKSKIKSQIGHMKFGVPL